MNTAVYPQPSFAPFSYDTKERHQRKSSGALIYETNSSIFLGHQLL